MISPSRFSTVSQNPNSTRPRQAAEITQITNEIIKSPPSDLELKEITADPPSSSKPTEDPLQQHVPSHGNRSDFSVSEHK